jgi:hypothetical protein
MHNIFNLRDTEIVTQARSSLYANTQLRAHRRAEEKKIEQNK